MSHLAITAELRAVIKDVSYFVKASDRELDEIATRIDAKFYEVKEMTVNQLLDFLRGAE